jgi:hypothetical protein
MKALPLLLLLTSMPLFGQSAQNSPPLDDGEKRVILGQLYELKSCRQETATYRDYVSRETELDAQQKQNSDRALELEKQATALAQKERDLATDKANFFEQAYRAVNKKPGIGCRIIKALTLGIARCN